MWTGPRQSEVLEQLLKRVSRGSGSSALELSAQFRSALILTTGSLALSGELFVSVSPVLKGMVRSLGLLHPFVKMPFKSLGITN